jgi:hypothetical protein
MYSTFKEYLSGITLEGDNQTVKICGVKAEFIRNMDYTPDDEGCTESNTENVLDFFGDILIKDERIQSGSTI